MKMEIPEEDLRLLETFGEKYGGFEIVTWAYLGIKKHSDFYKIDIDDAGKEILNQLGLELIYDGRVLQRIGWENEVKKKCYLGKINSDFDAGTLYDFPECCVDKYNKESIMTDDTLYKRRPFRGLSSHEEVQKTLESIDDKTELDKFLDDLNKHNKLGKEGRYSFYSEMEIVHWYYEDTEREMVRLVHSGKLPKHVFLMLNNCVPCEGGCEKFVEKTSKMYDALLLFGKDNADEVVEIYVERYQKWWKESYSAMYPDTQNLIDDILNEIRNKGE